MTTPNPPPKPIFIIGAGILGLTTALHLQTILPSNTPVALLAREFPTDTHLSPDYASAWAGAHYRPIPGSSPQLTQEAEMGRRTADVMMAFAEKYGEKVGVATCLGVEYLEVLPEGDVVVGALKSGDVYAGAGDGFRVLSAEELPEGVAWGCEYTAYTVNVPVYCAFLLAEFRKAGGRELRCELTSAAGAFAVGARAGLGDADVVVNCSGRNFDADPAVKILRGQTVLVRNQYDKTVTRQNRDGSWAVLIPRPLGGGTIVGVTREIGDMCIQAKPEVRRRLLESAVEFFPEFVGHVGAFEVVRDNVGRRPWREGGMRMEIERVEVEGKRRSIVHGYGAGGRGYELSWAIAEKLGELVLQTGVVVDCEM